MRQFILTIFAMLFCIGVANAAVKDAKVSVEFPSGSVKTLTLVNKNGRIDVDRVVGKRDIVINVTVKCTANTPEDAQKLLNSISIEESATGSAAAVNTVILSNKSIKNLLTGADYVIDYKVTVPWGVELNIINENGSVTIPNYSDKLTLQAQNCNVFVGDITGEATCLLVVKRGKCLLKGAEFLNAEFESCQYELGRVVSSTIKAKNGTGTIEEATITNLNLTGGSLIVGKAEDVSGSTVDCAVTIGDLGDCLNIDMVRKSLTINNVHFSFDKIMVGALWTDINLKFMENSGYNLTLQHDKRLRVNLPSDLKLGRLSASKKKSMIGSAYYGNPNRKSDVHLRLNAGTLTIK